MLELERGLASKLNEKKVRVDVQDADTVIFRNVPTNKRFFSKPRTNVLVKRPQEGLPYLVLVDEDLEYTGGDRAMARTFAGAPIQAGWRAILVVHDARDLQKVVEQALDALGFDGRDPALPLPQADRESAAGGALLSGFGTDITDCVAQATDEPTIGRDDEVLAVASALVKWGRARAVIVTGESGVGKTNLLYAVARRLQVFDPQFRVISVDLSAIFAGTMFPAERDNLLSSLLGEAAASPGTILALERFELIHGDAGHATHLLAHLLDSGVRLIGTTLPGHLPQFLRPPLARRLDVAHLAEPTPDETVLVLKELRERIAQHHRVEIDESCLRVCVQAADRLPGCYPAKALRLFDAAAARAAVSGAMVVGRDDIYAAAAAQTG